MKENLHVIDKIFTLLFFALMLFSAATVWSQQELVLNGSCDEYTTNTGDNSDAWDMTPNSTVEDNTGAIVDSPYRALWRNDDLETYLEQTYNSGGSIDEQPGAASDGTYDENGLKTKSVKLYDDGSPLITGSSRRLYQKIVVEAGEHYTFSIDSRSEAINVPSEVFILNEEITTEVGIENGVGDARVDYYLEITNDYNPSKGSASNNTFTNNTFDFTATTTTAVIYVRAMDAVDSDTEVYYDNISMVKIGSTASVQDVFGADFGIYPNPAQEIVQIFSKATIDAVEVFDIMGKKMLEFDDVLNNTINISNLPRGVYFVQLKRGKSSITKKLIKQ